MSDGALPRVRLDAAAGIVGLKPRSLANRRFRERHQIPAFKVGRALVFDAAELEAWLRRHREAVTGDAA
ncbi:MAG TPA: helix-turn-helix domain-containing protein [Verrucomicrobiae bacterium]|jgi:helix-turn-helix protein|nr:helix-turn-helix domain-containing protein [Verrucomicrobiae bacterium]